MKITRSLGSPFLAIPAAIVVGVIGWLTAEVPVPIGVASLATAVCALCLWPAFRWVKSGGRSLPMYEVVCLSFGVQYGFAAFAQPNQIVIFSQAHEIPWSMMRAALVLAALGVAALQAGHAVASRRRPRQKVLDLVVPPAKRPALVLTCAGVSVVGSAVVAVVGQWISLGAIGTVVSGLLILGASLLAIDACDLPPGPARTRRFLWLGVYLMLAAFLALGSGMVEGVATPLAVAMVIYVARTRNLPVFGIACVVLLVAVMNTAKVAVREETWGRTESRWERVAAWERAIRRMDLDTVVARDDETGQTSAMRALLYRFALLNRLAWVRVNTPESVPFFRGESYKFFLYTPIPRILWQDKPNIAESTAMLDFAYLLKDPARGNSYAIGVGYIAEAYANFSWPGVIVVMGLLGAGIGWASRLLNSDSSYGGAAIFGVCMIAFINGIGSTLVMICGAIVQIALCFALLLWYFAQKRPVGRRGTPPPRHV